MSFKLKKFQDPSSQFLSKSHQPREPSLRMHWISRYSNCEVAELSLTLYILWYCCRPHLPTVQSNPHYFKVTRDMKDSLK